MINLKQNYNNMKKLTKFLSIILIIMLTQSCSKDSACKNSETNIYYNIADSNKTKIPYKGNDTLVFVSDQGDTATFIGQSKKTYYITNSRNNSGNADCQWIENKNYENVDLSFTDIVSESKKLSISVFSELVNSNIMLTSIDIYLDNKLLIGRAFQFIDNEPIGDSVLINGAYLKGVFLDSDKTILFNYNQGILKYGDLNNNKWTLNQIK